MHEVLEVLVTQLLPRVDNSVHICLHQLSNDVDVVEAGRRRWLEHVNHVDDVVLVEELEEFDFSHDALSIDEVFKGFAHFLNSNLAAVLMIVCRADDTISTVTDLLYVLVLCVDVERSPYKTLDNQE